MSYVLIEKEKIMDKTLRTILWALVALVLLSSFSAGWFFVAKEKLYSDYLDLENLFKVSTDRLKREVASSKKENEKLRAQLAAADKELAHLESKNMEFERKYNIVSRETEDLRKELARVKKGKFFLEKKVKEIESDAFLASLLKEKATLEVEMDKVKSAAAPKSAEIESLKTEIAGLNMKISSLRRERDLIEKELKDSLAVAEVLSRDLSREKDRRLSEDGEIKGLRSENAALRSRIAETQDLREKYNNLVAEKEEMRFKAASLERDLERKVKEFDRLRTVFEEKKKEWKAEAVAYQPPQEVDLPPIVLNREGYSEREISSRGATKTMDINEKTLSGDIKTRGRVVTVNTEHGFVVVDLGGLQGVKEKDKFRVYRDNELIGALEVIQTRERISAADIKYEKGNYHVQVNDTVIKR